MNYKIAIIQEMKKYDHKNVKYNIAIASIITIFIGAVVYVPVLFFSKRGVDVVYKKVPVFITATNPVSVDNSDYYMYEDIQQQEDVDDGFFSDDLSDKALNLSFPIVTKDLRIGDRDPEVKSLQIYLNSLGFTVASSGPGSPGNETDFFGSGTRDALIRFQEENADVILKPVGLERGTGILGELTRKLINS